jgi:hypothetical protein
MSRVLFTSIGAALLATMLSMSAQAQQRPQIETTKVDGTDNVHIFRNGNHQSMFVVTKDGVTRPIRSPTAGRTGASNTSTRSRKSPTSRSNI